MMDNSIKEIKAYINDLIDESIQSLMQKAPELRGPFYVSNDDLSTYYYNRKNGKLVKETLIKWREPILANEGGQDEKQIWYSEEGEFWIESYTFRYSDEEDKSSFTNSGGRYYEVYCKNSLIEEHFINIDDAKEYIDILYKAFRKEVADYDL